MWPYPLQIIHIDVLNIDELIEKIIQQLVIHFQN